MGCILCPAIRFYACFGLFTAVDLRLEHQLFTSQTCIHASLVVRVPCCGQRPPSSSLMSSYHELTRPILYFLCGPRASGGGSNCDCCSCSGGSGGGGGARRRRRRPSPSLWLALAAAALGPALRLRRLALTRTTKMLCPPCSNSCCCACLLCPLAPAQITAPPLLHWQYGAGRGRDRPLPLPLPISQVLSL